jgi:hypothetical protein
MTDKKTMTDVKVVKITEIKSNPNNPRIIKDDKFKKLVESVKTFPEMANVRPIVVNTDMVVLGGNMRLKAMKEAGWKEAPIQIVDWDEQKQKEFIVKDNVGFGEWDWDDLANNWEVEELTEWGLNIPNWSLGHDINNMSENELDFTEQFDPIGIKSDKKNVTFVFNSEDEAKNFCENNGYKLIIKGELWKVEMNSQSI